MLNKLWHVIYVLLPLFTSVLAQTDHHYSGEAGTGTDAANESFMDMKHKEDITRAEEAALSRANEEEMRKTAAELLQLEENADHDGNPKNRLELSKLVLTAAFEVARETHDVEHDYDSSISVLNLIMNYLKSASGEARVFLMKMVELMDGNQDGYIGKDDFVNTLAKALAFPEHAINLMFKLYDQNRDGVITKYEWVQTDMLKMEDTTSILDLWRDAGLAFHDRDQNEDKVIDESEFALFALYELAKSIGDDVSERSLRHSNPESSM